MLVISDTIANHSLAKRIFMSKEEQIKKLRDRVAANKEAKTALQDVITETTAKIIQKAEELTILEKTIDSIKQSLSNDLSFIKKDITLEIQIKTLSALLDSNQ